MKATRVDEYVERCVPTVRVDVISNDTGEIAEIPQMNISNANAHQLLNMLSTFGIEVDPQEASGSFPADSYVLARQLIGKEAIQDFTRPYEESRGMGGLMQDLGVSEDPDSYEQEQEPSGPNVYSFGLGADRISDYLVELDKMVAWLDQNQVPDRTIIFA